MRLRTIISSMSLSVKQNDKPGFIKQGLIFSIKRGIEKLIREMMIAIDEERLRAIRIGTIL